MQQAHLTAWAQHAPWPKRSQLEQDLRISRGVAVSRQAVAVRAAESPCRIFGVRHAALRYLPLLALHHNSAKRLADLPAGAIDHRLITHESLCRGAVTLKRIVRANTVKTRSKMTIAKDVIPSGARNLLSNQKETAPPARACPERSRGGLGMTAHYEYRF